MPASDGGCSTAKGRWLRPAVYCRRLLSNWWRMGMPAEVQQPGGVNSSRRSGLLGYTPGDPVCARKILRVGCPWIHWPL